MSYLNGCNEVAEPLSRNRFSNINEIEILIDDKLVNKLNGMGLDYIQSFTEFINNSIAYKLNSNVVVDIKIHMSENHPNESYILITDNGIGIEDNNLAKCLSFVAQPIVTRVFSSEHGVGFKLAAATLGQLRSLKSKCLNNNYVSVIDFPKGYAVGKNTIKHIQIDNFNNGTEFEIRELKFKRKKEWITNTLVKELSTRYRYRLGKDLEINISYFEVDTGKLSDYKVLWNEVPLKVKLQSIVVADDVNVKVGGGYSREEYKDKKNFDKSNPYMRSGVLIEFLKDNVVIFNTKDVNLLPSVRNTNSYAPIRVEVNIDRFNTSLSKKEFANNEELKLIMTEVDEYIKNHKALLRDKTGKNYKEKKLVNKLVRILKNANPDATYQTNGFCENMNGKVDIIENRKNEKNAWECKAGEATGDDVSQLVGYIMQGDFSTSKANLVARSFGEGAKGAIEKLKSSYKIVIKLIPWSAFGL